MVTISVVGKTPLVGSVKVHGAKNAATKIFIASLLIEEPCLLDNVPELSDIWALEIVLQALGAEISSPAPHQRCVSAPHRLRSVLQYHPFLSTGLMAVVAAPVLHRMGRAMIPRLPGGDPIRDHSIDFHLDVYRSLGASVHTDSRYYVLECSRLKGANIALPFPSVTATECALIASVLSSGLTRISNAAVEPEVLDLVGFLVRAGAVIYRSGERCFEVTGVERLRGTAHHILPDRVAAASWAVAGAASGGEIRVDGIQPSDLSGFLEVYCGSGGALEHYAGGTKFFREGRPSLSYLETGPYPLFSTDWHPAIVLLRATSGGTFNLHETIFPGRLGYLHELRKLRVDISPHSGPESMRCCGWGRLEVDHWVQVRGGSPLYGSTRLSAIDIRGAFAIVLAAIIADGASIIDGIEILRRGYENPLTTFRQLGARIEHMAQP